MPGRRQNRKRVRPPGSADKVTIAERGSMRYTFHGGGPCDGALNGAVMPDPLSSGSAGRTVVRPRLRNTRHRARLGHSRSITLDYDVRLADRHRDRTPRIARDIAPLPRARARLEPEHAVEPQGTDRGHMRATVLVDGGQPGRAGVQRVRIRRRPCSKLLSNCGPIHRRQPIRLTKIDDLHKVSLHCPGDILANSIWLIRRSTAAEVIAHTRVTSHPSARTHRQERVSRGLTGRSVADNRPPRLRWTLARISWRTRVADQPGQRRPRHIGATGRELGIKCGCHCAAGAVFSGSFRWRAGQDSNPRPAA